MRRLFTILTVLAMVASVLGRVGVAWTCEGRICSSSARSCCCAPEGVAQDKTCPKASLVAADCEGGCGCLAVVTHAPEGLRHHAFSILADDVLPAIVPDEFEAPTFVALETPQVRAIPPPDGLACRVGFECAALRAPPVSLV
ncbi:hypothetical protein EON81_14650 [bacterium]|nr:MAG: hypothetical protein EON81_14650 [bacterium]